VKTSDIVSAALQIGASLIPMEPALQEAFSLAVTLVSEDRDPTPAEIVQWQTSIAAAHQQAQTILSQAQAKIAALAPLVVAVAAI
jgi:hypothetical protein